jgi:ferredoxin-NADP reductase
MNQPREYQWCVATIKNETPTVKSLYLDPRGERPDFVAGQYLTVRFPGVNPTEGKSYSISSAPHESQVRLSVKEIGDFSKILLNLSEGDEVFTTAPYGFFYPEAGYSEPLVFVVGGIGITPCLSIIKEMLHQGDERELFLHYSNQTVQEIAFHAELEELARTHPKLQISYYITRQEHVDPAFQAHRMEAKDILDFPNSFNAEYFICGSMDFTKALWLHLHQAGMQQHQLYTEGFF